LIVAALRRPELTFKVKFYLALTNVEHHGGEH
jgi:hypothetical protein